MKIMMMMMGAHSKHICLTRECTPQRSGRSPPCTSIDRPSSHPLTTSSRPHGESVPSAIDSAPRRHQKDTPMNDPTLAELTRQIMDETGLDEVTAATIASAHIPAPHDQAPPNITRSTAQNALTAPPTANEPATIEPSYTTRCEDCAGAG